MSNQISKNTALKARWEALTAKSPMRIREAAAQLGVSEAELLATGIGTNTVRLGGPWEDLLKRFKKLGYVMSLTRNDACVLEHKGIFDRVRVFGGAEHQMGTVIGPIETRVFFKNWGYAFANTMNTGKEVMKNIQIFDKSGEAVTKVYLQPKSDHEAYEQLVADFKAEDQSAELNPQAKEAIEYNYAIDEAAFIEEWRNLKDTHDFFPLLSNYKAHRHKALEIAEGEFTRQVGRESITSILEQAANTQLPIMIFAGNHGNLQIHQDVVKKIIPLERGGQNWINVMDSEFNLHLRRDKIAHTWVVKKPTTDGIVTSVEVFDARKDLICQFFGKRKPGQTELTEWTDLVAKLE